MSDLFAAHNLCKRFGGVHALRNVEVMQRAGETLGMIGPNGSGKTSFVNAVTGDLRARQRQKSISRAPTSPARVRTRSPMPGSPAPFRRCGCSRGSPCATTSRPRCWCSKIRHIRSKPPGGVELLQWLKLDNRLDATAGSLTLFEQRRLELAMRLMLRPRLIMLDEPVGGLAPGEIRAMMQILQELKARCTIFVIEHTMRVIRELADRVVVLITGEKVADGPPAEILKDKRVIEQYLGTAHA